MHAGKPCFARLDARGHARCKRELWIRRNLMKKTHLSPALALLGLTVSLGVAQAQNGTMDKPMTGKSMMDKSMMATSDADKKFMVETAQGSVYDQATAELAVQKAQSKSVQRYALRLMDDHNRLNKELLIQANKRGLSLPLTLSDDDNTKLQNLMDKQMGSEFDMAYLQEAVQINADDVRKGNAAINASSDTQFRSLMHDYVTTEQKHLDQASALLTAMQKEMGMKPGGAMNGTMMNGTPQNTTPGMMNPPSTTN